MTLGDRLLDIFIEIAPIFAIVLCLIALALDNRRKKNSGSTKPKDHAKEKDQDE